ncbi:MAG: hypothetical protein HFH73_12105 [Lachnospiraceae bacterium]|nr:hypothetical protein [Lachnospiraceae bacterium]
MDSGNITEKKTRQQLADELNINVKTMRNAIRYTRNVESIEKNIGEERAKKFDDVINSLHRNKKEKVSDEQIMQLSRVSPQEQIRIVNLIIGHPQNAKQIINNAIPYCRTKVTVTLPSFVSEWLDSAACDVGMSKGKYIEKLLIELCENAYKEDIND